MLSAVGVEASTAFTPKVRPGSSPRAALQNLRVTPISLGIAKRVLTKNHYLHSLPGGTQLAFGFFIGSRLMGALTIGCGHSQAYRLVKSAGPDDCAVLTRLWLSDELPANSESRVIGIVLRALRKNTGLKFLLSYADPSQGHVGTIYQAIGWIYTGESDAVPLYCLGEDAPRHSRSFSHVFGTRSKKHFERLGVELKTVPQGAKHRYIYFLNPTWKDRLKAPILPYPKKGKQCE